MTVYSKWLRPASRCSWASIAAGSRMMTPIRLSQASRSMPCSQRGSGSAASCCSPAFTPSWCHPGGRPRVGGPAECADQARWTRPAAPSTVTRSPVAIRAVASGTPTTAGMPYSRATTAPCEFGPAHLHHQPARGEEQRGPAGVGGRRDEDLARLQLRADRVEDDARRRGDGAGRGRRADQRAVVRGAGRGRAPRARCRRTAAPAARAGGAARASYSSRRLADELPRRSAPSSAAATSRRSRKKTSSAVVEQAARGQLGADGGQLVPGEGDQPDEVVLGRLAQPDQLAHAAEGEPRRPARATGSGAAPGRRRPRRHARAACAPAANRTSGAGGGIASSRR